MNRWMKYITCIGLACMVGGAIFFGLGYFNHGLEKASETQDRVEMKQTAIEDVNALNVNLSVYDFHVKRSSDDQFHLSWKGFKKGDKDPIQWKEENGTLSINENKASKTNFVQINLPESNDETSVTLYVPEGKTIKDVHINGSDSYMYLNHLNADSMSLTTKTGDLSLKDVQVQDLMINSNDGNVEMDQSSANEAQMTTKSADVAFKQTSFAQGTITTSSGDVEIIEGNIDQAVQIETKTGDCEVQLKNAWKDLALQLETKTGSIEAPDLNYDQKIDDDNKQVLKKNGEGPSLTITSKDGDIELK